MEKEKIVNVNAINEMFDTINYNKKRLYIIIINIIGTFLLLLLLIFDHRNMIEYILFLWSLVLAFYLKDNIKELFSIYGFPTILTSIIWLLNDFVLKDKTNHKEMIYDYGVIVIFILIIISLFSFKKHLKGLRKFKKIIDEEYQRKYANNLKLFWDDIIDKIQENNKHNPKIDFLGLELLSLAHYGYRTKFSPQQIEHTNLVFQKTSKYELLVLFGDLDFLKKEGGINQLFSILKNTKETNINIEIWVASKKERVEKLNKECYIAEENINNFRKSLKDVFNNLKKEDKIFIKDNLLRRVNINCVHDKKWNGLGLIGFGSKEKGLQINEAYAFSTNDTDTDGNKKFSEIHPFLLKWDLSSIGSLENYLRSIDLDMDDIYDPNCGETINFKEEFVNLK